MSCFTSSSSTPSSITATSTIPPALTSRSVISDPQAATQPENPSSTRLLGNPHISVCLLSGQQAKSEHRRGKYQWGLEEGRHGDKDGRGRKHTVSSDDLTEVKNVPPPATSEQGATPSLKSAQLNLETHTHTHRCSVT